MEYLPITMKKEVKEEYEQPLEDEICEGELTNALKYCNNLLQEENLLTDKPLDETSFVSIVKREVICKDIIDILGEQEVETEDNLILLEENESEGSYEEVCYIVVF